MENNNSKNHNAEKIDMYINKLISDQEKRNLERKNLFSNYDYVTWLISFTNRFNDFTDVSWLYNDDELTTEEKQNVDKLPLFYEGIKLYASKNYIYPKYNDGMCGYLVRVGDYGFEIGVINGQDICYYCSRKEMENEIGYIDIADIVTDKKQANVDAITSMLNSLSTSIDTVYNHGVPVEAINKLLKDKMEQLSYRDIIINSSKNTK